MATRDDLQAICEARWRDTSNDVVLDADWVRYLDTALRHVNGSSPLWPWLETESDATVTVAAGTRSGSLPADVVQVNSVYNDTDDYPLKPYQGRSGHFVAQTNDSTDTPQFYRLRGSKLEVFPKPAIDTTLFVEVLTWPGSFASAATEPPFPETFHYILVEGAMALSYLDDGNSEWYTVHWAVFEAQIEQMKDALLNFRAESYPRVRDNFWD